MGGPRGDTCAPNNEAKVSTIGQIHFDYGAMCPIGGVDRLREMHARISTRRLSQISNHTAYMPQLRQGHDGYTHYA